MKAEQYINIELEATVTVPVPIPADADYMDREFDLEAALERAVDHDNVVDYKQTGIMGITPSDRLSLRFRK